MVGGARPNVVLIAADTTRPDHLGCYGYTRATSPNVDRLAAEGAVFEDVQAAHIPTHPAFTTLLSGVDPLYHGIVRHAGEEQLRPDVPLLAERLRAAGYLTLAVDNMMTMQSAPGWFARGFDYFRAYRYQPGTGEAARVTDRALALLALARAFDRPYFLFVHYFDPHAPYLPPTAFRRRFYQGDEADPANTSMREAIEPDDPLPLLLLKELGIDRVTDLAYPIAQYDGEIAFMDAEIGRLLAAVEEGGGRERTLSIFLSDHGEAFGEGGLYFNHHTLHDVVTRCALVLRRPGVVPAGARVAGLASSLDVAPTILELAGLEPVAPAAVAGRSLLPLLAGRPVREEAPLGEATMQISRGVVTPDWRLVEPVVATADGEPVLDFRGRPRDPAIRLYHRPSDPLERRDVAAERPGVVADLLGRLRARQAVAAALSGVADPLALRPPTQPYRVLVERFSRR